MTRRAAVTHFGTVPLSVNAAAPPITASFFFGSLVKGTAGR